VRAVTLRAEPSGRSLAVGPRLTVVPRPDARVLVAVAGVPAQPAQGRLDKDLLAFLQELVGGSRSGQLALAASR
jgi:hypothetical protein